MINSTSSATVKFIDNNKNGQVDDQDRVEIYEGKQKIWEGSKKEFTASQGDLVKGRKSDDYLSGLSSQAKLDLLQDQLKLQNGKTPPPGSFIMKKDGQCFDVSYAEFIGDKDGKFEKDFGLKEERKEKVREMMSLPPKERILHVDVFRPLTPEQLEGLSKPSSELHGEEMKIIYPLEEVFLDDSLSKEFEKLFPKKSEPLPRREMINQPKPGCLPGKVAP